MPLRRQSKCHLIAGVSGEAVRGGLGGAAEVPLLLVRGLRALVTELESIAESLRR